MGAVQQRKWQTIWQFGKKLGVHLIFGGYSSEKGVIVCLPIYCHRDTQYLCVKILTMSVTCVSTFFEILHI